LWLCEVWGKPSQFFKFKTEPQQVQNRVLAYHRHPNLAKPLLANRLFNFRLQFSYFFLLSYFTFKYLIMKFIDVTENGSNLIKTIATDKIKTLESFIFKDGTDGCIISFTDKTELWVNQSKSTIMSLIG
jgi:hypothetical protein